MTIGGNYTSAGAGGETSSKVVSSILACHGRIVEPTHAAWRLAAREIRCNAQGDLITCDRTIDLSRRIMSVIAKMVPIEDILADPAGWFINLNPHYHDPETGVVFYVTIDREPHAFRSEPWRHQEFEFSPEQVSAVRMASISGNIENIVAAWGGIYDHVLERADYNKVNDTSYGLWRHPQGFVLADIGESLLLDWKEDGTSIKSDTLLTWGGDELTTVIKPIDFRSLPKDPVLWGLDYEIEEKYIPARLLDIEEASDEIDIEKTPHEIEIEFLPGEGSEFVLDERLQEFVREAAEAETEHEYEMLSLFALRALATALIFTLCDDPKLLY